MKVLIIGAGRMGLRHAVGLASMSEITNISIVDISTDALLNAKRQFENSEYFNKYSFHDISFLNSCTNYGVCIIATTASNRRDICEKIVLLGIANVLIEKPLGQSLEEVLDLINLFKDTKSKAYVNLNMRINPNFVQLKHDLISKQQLHGYKIITINTGAIGIGANGIHYLDFLNNLLDADHSTIVNCSIQNEPISSARGELYRDFGGWCMLDYFKKEEKVGTAFLSINALSSVFGGIDIVAPHGRIFINESSGKRFDFLRDPTSTLPTSRYHADYFEPLICDLFNSALSDLTREWMESILNSKSCLPSVEESLHAHALMFEWLSNSKETFNKFPIT